MRGPFLTLVIAALFVVVLRKALRWGAVGRGHGISSGMARVIFPVGQTGAFVMALIATYGFGYLLVDLGATAQWDGYRVSVELLAWSAVYGSLFVVAVWGVAAMMPLDVVLDDSGLTFAGAMLPWAEIRGVKRVDSWAVAVEGGRGDLHLGPGKQSIIDKLESAIRLRLPPGE